MLGLALSLLSPGACSPEAPPEVERVPVSVVVEEVHREPLAPMVTVAGVVQARARIELAFRVTGVVVRFHVDEGDAVEEGQLLAELEDSDFRHAVAAAESELARSRARAAEARADRERQEKLAAARAVSEDRLERARFATEVADAEERLARVRLAEAREQLARVRLTAPARALVEMRLAEEHEAARALQPVLVLVQVDTVLVRAAVADTVVREVSVGDAVRVRSAAGSPAGIPGEVVRIGVSADPATRTVPVEIEVENEGARLKPEVVVEVDVPVGGASEAILAPLPAVLRDALPDPFCFVVNGKGAERRRVELGPIHGERVSVLSGLAPGDRLVVRGQHFIRQGDTVRVVEP